MDFNNLTSEDMDKILNVPFVFGLVAQGHIPTIENMLKENKNWEEIGKAIGWCPKTAHEHYQSYLKREKNDH